MNRFKGYFAASAILVAIASGAIFNGCSDSSTTPPKSEQVIPKTGSTYTYNQHLHDSTATGVTDNDSVKMAMIVSSGQSFMGRTNVMTAVENGDTTIYSIESNGDVYLYVDHISQTVAGQTLTFNPPVQWLPLTFGSKATTETTIYTKDTSITISNVPVTVSITAKAKYLGTETLAIAGQSNATGGQSQLSYVITVTVPFVGSIDVKTSQQYSFDSNLGYFFHTISTFDNPGLAAVSFAGQSRTTEQKLTAYSIVK